MTTDIEMLEMQDTHPVQLRSHSAAIRGLDIVFSLAGLLVFLPLLVILMIAVRVDSPGPAIFRQTRTGYMQKPFRMLKLRTMFTGSNTSGPCWVQHKDDRITRLGVFLRARRLDELPQLINILKGEMSFVGPRACRPSVGDEIARHNPQFYRRYLVKPGLTGYAQLSARYGIDMDEQLAKIPHDMRYLSEGLKVQAYISLIAITAVRCIFKRFGD